MLQQPEPFECFQNGRQRSLPPLDWKAAHSLSPQFAQEVKSALNALCDLSCEWKFTGHALCPHTLPRRVWEASTSTHSEAVHSCLDGIIDPQVTGWYSLPHLLIQIWVNVFQERNKEGRKKNKTKYKCLNKEGMSNNMGRRILGRSEGRSWGRTKISQSA